MPKLLAPVLLFAIGAGAAQGQQLLDNGPVRTGVGDGVDGTDTSAVQVGSGQTILGYGAGSSGGLRLADDFVVPSPGWRVRGVRVPAFQRGAEIGATPLLAMNLRIWSGDPGAPGSTVVFGDESTDRLAQSAFSGVHRVMGARVGDASAPLFDAIGNFSVVLAPGTYWVDWQLQGSLASGPLVPPVTRAGQAGSGNARQFLGDGWYPIAGVAGAGQELPFTVTGTVLEFEGQLFSDGFEAPP